MNSQTPDINKAVANALKSKGLITVLTGAGISADSGIPTFRGQEGYWTIGSKNFMPTEMATKNMLLHNPEEVWKWYIYRFGICADASPNPGHHAIAQMEKLLGDRFRLITQNVDGLHLRAGNSPPRTLQIHGNLNFMRCLLECSTKLYPMPVKRSVKEKSSDLSPAEWELLKCPVCGAITRPHVLFFDEYYNELHFKFESSLKVAKKTSLLVVVGTTGTTNLPNQIVHTVFQGGGTIVNINIDTKAFSQAAPNGSSYFFLKGESSVVLPQLVNRIKECLTG